MGKRFTALFISLCFLFQTTFGATLTIIERNIRYSLTKTSGNTVNVETKEGSEITGWKVTSDNVTVEGSTTDTDGKVILPTTASFTMPTTDVTLEATYPIAEKFLLTVENFGVITRGLKSKDSEVVVTATSTTQYQFSGWTATGITLTAEQIASPTITFNMPGNNVTILANYGSTTVQVNTDASNANAPVLVSGLTPVNWDGSSWQTTTELGWRWNYNSVASVTQTTIAGNGDCAWANAMTEDGSLYVWIPRFTYKILSGEHQSVKSWNSDLVDGTEETLGQISIIFSNGTTDNTSNGYQKHPAFTFGNDELEGFWVAKYEASQGINTSTTDTISIPTETSYVVQSKPGVTSWRDISVSKMYDYAYNTFRSADSHLMKNTEWGAVAYLTNAIGKIPYINYNENYLTGYAGTNPNGGASTEEGGWSTVNGVKGSSTHNVYGVYDLVGGGGEFVSAYYTGSTSNSPSWTSGDTTSETPYQYSGRLYENKDTKYVDKYETLYSASNTGDALYETSSSCDDEEPVTNGTRHSWDGDFSYFENDYPVVTRGGYRGNGSDAGLFSFYGVSGEGTERDTFRTVLATTQTTTYTITYDANGGSDAPAAQIVTSATATLSTTTPTRSGYTFAGWATSSTATAGAYSAGSTITLTGDITLYAVWTEESEVPSTGSISISETLTNKSTVTISVSNVTNPDGIAGVTIRQYFGDGELDITNSNCHYKEYVMTSLNNGSGSYTATFYDIPNLTTGSSNCGAGTYHFVVGVTSNSGNYTELGTLYCVYSTDVTPPTGTASISKTSTNESTVTISVSNVTDPSGVAGVTIRQYFGDGELDITDSNCHYKEYVMTSLNSGSGSYTATFSGIPNLTTGATGCGYGTYYFVVGATDNLGNYGEFGELSCIYNDGSAPTGTISISKTATNENTVTINVSGVTDPDGVSGVTIRAYHGTGGLDITNTSLYYKEYTISGSNLSNGSGSCVVTFSEIPDKTSNVMGSEGRYCFKVGATDTNDNYGDLGIVSCVYDVTSPQITSITYDSGWKNTSIYKQVMATDALSGIDVIEYSYDLSTWYSDWDNTGSSNTTDNGDAEAVLTESGVWTSKTWSGEQNRVVYFRTKDKAGNMYVYSYDGTNPTPYDLKIDTTAPYAGDATVTAETTTWISGASTEVGGLLGSWPTYYVSSADTAYITVSSTGVGDALSGASHFEYYLRKDGGASTAEYNVEQSVNATAGTGYVKYGINSEGSYAVERYIVDSAGNRTKCDECTVVYDKSVPTSSGTIVASGYSEIIDGVYYVKGTSGNVVLNILDMVDAGVGIDHFDVYIKKDGAERTKDYNNNSYFATGCGEIDGATGKVAYNLTSEGTYVTEIYIYDAFNIHAAAAPVTIVVDGSAPTSTDTVLVSATNSSGTNILNSSSDHTYYVKGTSASVQLNIQGLADNLAGVYSLDVYIKKDGGARTKDLNGAISIDGTTGVINYNLTSEGTYVTEIYMYDKIGNCQAAVPVTIVLDGTVPTSSGTSIVSGVTLNENPTGYTNNPNAEVQIRIHDIADNLSGVYSLDIYMKKDGAERTKAYNNGASIEGTTGIVNYKLNGYGVYVSEIYIYDRCGNHRAAGVITIRCDNIHVTSGATDSGNGVNYTTTDGSAEITITFDNLPSNIDHFDIYMKKDGAARVKTYNTNTTLSGTTATIKYTLQGSGVYVTEIYPYASDAIISSSTPLTIVCNASNLSISASAGSGGTISDSGSASVAYGGSKSYTVTANSGYHISSISVDGVAQAITNYSSMTYTFSNVQTNHTIYATFAGHGGGNATCTSAAVCSTCGVTYASALGHSTSTSWSKNGSSHWKVCTRCNATVVAAAGHSGGTNTCTSAAVCSTCGVTYGSVLGHDYSGAFGTNASQHWKYCSRNCGTLVVGYTNHYGATASNGGTCTACGYAYAVTSLSISGGSATVLSGYTLLKSKTSLNLVTSGSNTDRGITWSSSNNSIATVNNGIVTGVGAGVVTITATGTGGIASSSINLFVWNAHQIGGRFSVYLSANSNDSKGTISGTDAYYAATKIASSASSTGYKLCINAQLNEVYAPHDVSEGTTTVGKYITYYGPTHKYRNISGNNYYWDMDALD